MDTITLTHENIKLKEENTKLKIEIEELTNKLKKYTNTESHRNYYEQNKDKIKTQGSNYLKKIKETNPEKIKEYSKRAYQKAKLKKQQTLI